MTQSALTPDTVLRLTAATDPAPWFPSQYAHDAGIDRNSLDEPLNQLRIKGLVRIGGWEAGRGQCYVLTDAGRAAAATPGDLPRLLNAPTVRPSTPAAGPRSVRSTAWERGEAVRGAFFANSPTPVLYALIAIQVIVFIAGLAAVMRARAPVGFYLERGLIEVPAHGAGQAGVPALESLVLFTPDLAHGQWWQLLTYALVHFGLLHLGMNLYGHYALGPLVERMFGSARFLALYLLSALGGGIAAVLLRGSAEPHTAGSSGALCGLIGGFAAFVILNRRHLGSELFDQCRRWLGNTVVLLILFSMLPQVSWQCHLGGFVAGFVAGVLLTYHRFGTAEQRWAALLGLVLLPVAGLTPLVEKGILRLSPRPETAPLEVEVRSTAEEYRHFLIYVWGNPEKVRLKNLALRDDLIDPLRYRNPAARDPSAVAIVLGLSAQAKTEEESLLRQLEQIHPYRTADLEEVRKLAIDYVRSTIRVTVAYKACFERGAQWAIYSENGESDEMRLQQALNDELEAALRFWRAGLRAVKARDPVATLRPAKPAHR